MLHHLYSFVNRKAQILLANAHNQGQNVSFFRSFACETWRYFDSLVQVHSIIRVSPVISIIHQDTWCRPFTLANRITLYDELTRLLRKEIQEIC